ncbi:uncharacterized protein BYT42DRAFT_579632, partial [Radiomyces spectabilis]|uniref:uncharacterized protein n=1 Tax=Radiomyces spectabilis TaxID=64574 RepID=UPI002220A57E
NETLDHESFFLFTIFLHRSFLNNMVKLTAVLASTFLLAAPAVLAQAPTAFPTEMANLDPAAMSSLSSYLMNGGAETILAQVRRKYSTLTIEISIKASSYIENANMPADMKSSYQSEVARASSSLAAAKGHSAASIYQPLTAAAIVIAGALTAGMML